MRKKNKLKHYINALLLSLSYYCSAWADDIQIKANAASEGTPVVWYACPLINNHISYTTSPLDVQCQLAKHPPSGSDDLKLRSLESINAPGLEQLQRLWYSAEFGQDSDLTKLSTPAKIGIHLRQQLPNKTDSGTANKNTTIPAKIIVTPKLTPKQLVQRDIVSEQRALAIAEQQLKQARKQGIAIQIQRWQKNIVDRQANIRVLKQELSHY